MAVIHNLKELNELGRDLDYHDYIHFITPYKEYRYSIHKDYLKILDLEYSYAIIFKYIGLNNIEKYNLAEKCYGYKTPERCQHPENWPHYKKNDYQALERLIREIYKRLGDSSIKINNEEFITSRFEILDL